MSASAGHCLCGSVSFTAEDLVAAEVCHCATCQRWCGGPLIYVAARTVRFDNEACLLRYKSSDWGERLSCQDCGSAVAWHFTAETRDDGTVMERPWDVCIGVLDSPPVDPIAQEIFCTSKPAAYEFTGSHPRFAAMPNRHEEPKT